MPQLLPVQANRMISLLVISLCMVPAGYAEMFKWTDAEGNIVYSQSPPPGDIQAETISLKEVTEKLIEEVEKKLIRQALDIAHGHRGEAAKILKIDPKTLYNKIQKYFPQESEEPAPILNKKTGT